MTTNPRRARGASSATPSPREGQARRPRRDIPIDWPQLVLNLRSSGMTDEQIADQAGYAERHAVWQLANGKVHEPRFGRAVALLNLHHDRCAERHADLLL